MLATLSPLERGEGRKGVSMISRRSLIAGLSSTLLLPRLARSQSVTDATGWSAPITA